MNANVERGLDLAAQGTQRIYENEIPAFARHALERLYQNTFSSAEAEHVRQPGTHTYVAWSGAVAIVVLLFRLDGDNARVLNAAIELEAQAIECFAACLFARYPQLRSVELRSVAIDAPSGRYPCQRFRTTEDFVLSLPSSVEAYMEQLGSAGKRLEYFARKVGRRLPGFGHEVHEGARIERGLVRSVLEMKLRQNADKLGYATLDATQQAWLERAVAAYGFVAVTRVEGRICAGAVCTRVGANVFMHVLAHDPAFDAFGVGKVNTFLTIRAAIERGVRECHFLWGHGSWKSQFRGEPRALHDMLLYRSRAACVACLPTVVRATGRACYWRTRAGVRDAAARYRPVAQLLHPCLAGWRRLRRAAPRLAALARPAPVAEEP